LSTPKKRQVKSGTSTNHHSDADTRLTEHDGAEPLPSLSDQIALRAYAYWEARGGPLGSPEEDWLRAEAEIHGGPQADS
jgi:Protein of unknown function (DUF2934)